RIEMVGSVSEQPSGRVVHAEETSPSVAQREDIFSPAVLRLAQLEGLSVETLRKIDGTGDGGRITKKDIERFVAMRNSPCPLAGPTTTPAPVTAEGEVERIALTGMRKAIAENMVRSFYEAPHASLVLEADVTDVMKLIAREKE